MKWILYVLIGLVGLILLMVVIGWLLPKEHVASRKARYHRPPEAVWEALTNIDAMPNWREGLKSVKKLPDENGRTAYIEVTTMGEIPLRTLEAEPPKKIVREISDPKLPFGGTWTFEITPAAEGSELRITERGYVNNPLFRFLSRFVFGYNGNIESVLRSLAKKFGEQPQIGE